MAPVATASLAETPQQHVGVNRPNMVQVGTIVWLSSELMFFAGLFAMYFTIRAVRPDLWSVEPGKLNIPFSAANTINLVASSIWCQMGVFAAERFQPRTRANRWWKIWTREHGLWTWGMREWYTLTYVAGALFIAGQVYEYAHLVEEGVSISPSAYGSVFYLTTGFHGLHVTGGLIAFLFFLARTALGRFTPAQATSAIVVSYYWHFVDVVWIALFSMIYWLR